VLTALACSSRGHGSISWLPPQAANIELRVRVQGSVRNSRPRLHSGAACTGFCLRVFNRGLAAGGGSGKVQGGTRRRKGS